MNNTRQISFRIREDEYQMLLKQAKKRAKVIGGKPNVGAEIRGIMRGKVDPLPFDNYWDK